MRDRLLHRVQETIDRHRMLAAGETIVLAVSGGVDSMVMLHLLLRLRTCYHTSLHVAHLNHDLRGTESAEAANFVRRQCEVYQIPVTIMRADGRALRDRESGSLQAAARDLRYRFLEQVAGEQGADRIALGHHRDDQAETVLMNLLRGSGVRGLGGIPPVRGRIIRPLIDCSREEIERYARKEERIPYVEDSSNRILAYSRNRIRLELLPELAKRYNPRVVHALANAATILEAEDTLLDGMADKELCAVLISRSREKLVLSISRMVTLPSALRWRIIRRAAEELRAGHPGLTFQQTLAIDRLLMTKDAKGAIYAPSRLRVRRVGDGIVLAGEGPVRGRIVPCPLAVPGFTVIPGSSFSLRSELLERRAMDDLAPDAWTALLDADRTGLQLHVRGWEDGDRFVPLGMSGRKKLQDFFVDAKVPRDQRGSVPLVVSGGRIAWVVGFRVDERFKVADSTRRVLRVCAAVTGQEAK